MAVLAYKGDLRHLACHAWYLPGDVDLQVARPWWADDPELRRALLAAAKPPGWGETGQRVLKLRLQDPRRATPVLAAIPSAGTNDWRYHRETLRQFVDLALTVPRPMGLPERERPLLAVPLIGTGYSTWRPDYAAHLEGLLAALHEETERQVVDLVAVVRDDVAWAALQALRRRRLVTAAPDPALIGLTDRAAGLAAHARAGRLVLFTGAGVGRPAGLPDWTELLTDLAEWAGFDETAAKRLSCMDLLDQAALIGGRKATGELADEVARRLEVPHHALAHGLLANLPVTENITLNYDQLFEQAARDAGSPVSVLPYEPAEDRWLLKLHGCTAPGRRQDIVLTRGDYLSLGQHRAALTGIVQALLVTRHMLFVGFGLTDDHLHAVVHDVRRALGAARTGKLGTALLLEHDPLQEELWQQDLDYLAMGSGGVQACARRLELFLDHLLLLCSTSDAHLFDKAYAPLLTLAEVELRDAVHHAVADLQLAESSAGRRVAALLSELGWRR